MLKLSNSLSVKQMQIAQYNLDNSLLDEDDESARFNRLRKFWNNSKQT
jgi:hypothetical protein